ncbi:MULTISPECIES: class I SAM-dependent methyltransferase [Listeria]|uniref:class I SAM-dependent DNA methyltransferase n=1 Tax=Listeria TaxID=1637 RepID=UPI000B594265|nr:MULTISPECIES: class I SAM-dependent methyltransferase [Listeria]
MSYEFFPQVYDELMDVELYDEWADFAHQVLPKDKKTLLDLASGTGEFAIRMHFQGYDVTGLDLSEEMVHVAEAKMNATNLPIPFLAENMTNFSFQKSFDVVTCFCDSLNYLETEKELDATFERVYEHLNTDGAFLFDVHSVYKVDVGFQNYSYGDSDLSVSTIWNSFPGEAPHSVEHELTFFVENSDGSYFRKDELHKERTYPVATYEKKLIAAGFSKISVYADFSLEKPDEKSERIFFLARK